MANTWSEKTDKLSSEHQTYVSRQTLCDQNIETGLVTIALFTSNKEAIRLMF